MTGAGRGLGGVPRGLPVRAEALAVRRSADQELASLFPLPKAPKAEASDPSGGGILGRDPPGAHQVLHPGGPGLALAAGPAHRRSKRGILDKPGKRLAPLVGRPRKQTVFAGSHHLRIHSDR